MGPMPRSLLRLGWRNWIECRLHEARTCLQRSCQMPRGLPRGSLLEWIHHATHIWHFEFRESLGWQKIFLRHSAFFNLGDLHPVGFASLFVMRDNPHREPAMAYEGLF